MPLPTDFADLEPEDSPPQRTARPPTLAHSVTHVQLHQTNKAVNKLGERHDEFEAKVDATIPGADYNTHREHHERIMEREIESKKLWSEVRKALLISLIMLLGGATGTGLWNYLKLGGILK